MAAVVTAVADTTVAVIAAKNRHQDLHVEKPGCAAGFFGWVQS
jgi:hypothetical protein